MNFELDETETAIRDDARRLLSDHGGTRKLAAEDDGPIGFDRELWDTVANLGWLGVAIDEAAGGAGFGKASLGCLIEEAGRVLAPVPLVTTAIAVEALASLATAEQRDAWLPELITGSRTVAFATTAGAHANPLHRAGGTASGTIRAVAFADTADALLYVDAQTGSVHLIDLAAPGCERTTAQHFDVSRPYGHLRLDNARTIRLGEGEAAAAAAVLDIAATLLGFEQIGGAAACLDQAKAYAAERRAYGRQIGSFQSVKHRLADDFVRIEIARSHAYRAAISLDRPGGDLPRDASATWLGGSDAFAVTSHDNLIVHGGTGFTWELDCHLYVRRAATLSRMLGSTEYWDTRLVDRLAAARGLAGEGIGHGY